LVLRPKIRAVQAASKPALSQREVEYAKKSHNRNRNKNESK
jgi:hypothetical protein